MRIKITAGVVLTVLVIMVILTTACGPTTEVSQDTETAPLADPAPPSQPPLPEVTTPAGPPGQASVNRTDSACNSVEVLGRFFDALSTGDYVTSDTIIRGPDCPRVLEGTVVTGPHGETAFDDYGVYQLYELSSGERLWFKEAEMNVLGPALVAGTADKEAAWVQRVSDWGYAQRDRLVSFGEWIEDPAGFTVAFYGDANGRAQLDRRLRPLRTCSAALKREVGPPPTKRLRAINKPLKLSCKSMEKTARKVAQSVVNQDISLFDAAATDLEEVLVHSEDATAEILALAP